ncbi:MAG: GNAT family N-acetyltransferase [Thermoplasmata archaeon]
MIRELRKTDAPRVLEFLTTQFPEEEAILGTRPEGFAKVVHRLFRWDTQLALGIARLFHRPIFRFFVVEENGRLVATTLLSFPERTGYVSMVVVDPAYRRRGHARALLERARTATAAAGRRYIALDVLAENTPARALYEQVGYRPLRDSSYLVRVPGTVVGDAGAGSTAVRPFRGPDARAVVEIAARSTPPEVGSVLPLRERALRGSGFVNGILGSEAGAWVVDRGTGPEAYLGAVATDATDAGHLTDPIVGEGVDAADSGALVRTAVAWLSARGGQRVVVQVPSTNVRGRAALLGEGFHDALALWTLYRPVD